MKISIYLAGALLIISTVIGISFGYYLTPEYRMNAYLKNKMSLGEADLTFDLRYINAMISHHRGAMLLAEQLIKNTEREELQKLAANILKEEPIAIAELYQWKKDWYGDIKTVQDPIVNNLGPKGENFDLRFLNAMITHHEEGILMTKETKIKSIRAEILDNAYLVENFLLNGIQSLTDLRQKWYQI